MPGRDKLSDRRARTAPPGKYSDGAGLWLFVKPDLRRTWVVRFTLNGKRREMGLGALSDVSLKRARELARDARALAGDGEDPIAHRKAQARKRSEAASMTFEEAALAYIDVQAAAWKNPKHRQQWKNTLERYAFAKIGAVAVHQVTTQDVMDILKPIWSSKTETATRLRNRIERVLDWAGTMGHRSGDNPARWRGHLANLLPPPNKVARKTHFAALPWKELPKFMDALAQQDGVAAIALRFAILTAARSSEVRLARWSEIDLEARLWSIAAERMKMDRPHRVPLSSGAVDVLRAAAQHGLDGYVFPSSQRDAAMSDMTMTAVLRRMKVDLTVHGFRSTFKDWAAEATSYPNEVSEMALAHKISNAVEAAYRRGDLLKKRQAMMQDWCDFALSGRVDGADVLPIRAGRS